MQVSRVLVQCSHRKERMIKFIQSLTVVELCHLQSSGTKLETLAVVWAIKHYLAYLYGHNVVVYTDHSAVRAVLNSPQLNGKHARWWSLIHGGGIKNLEIKYRPGRENANADALSRSPVVRTGESEMVTDVQVATIKMTDCDELLRSDPAADIVALTWILLPNRLVILDVHRF